MRACWFGAWTCRILLPCYMGLLLSGGGAASAAGWPAAHPSSTLTHRHLLPPCCRQVPPDSGGEPHPPPGSLLQEVQEAAAQLEVSEQTLGCFLFLEWVVQDVGCGSTARLRRQRRWWEHAARTIAFTHQPCTLSYHPPILCPAGTSPPPPPRWCRAKLLALLAERPSWLASSAQLQRRTAWLPSLSACALLYALHALASCKKHAAVVTGHQRQRAVDRSSYTQQVFDYNACSGSQLASQTALEAAAAERRQGTWGQSETAGSDCRGGKG